MPYNDRNQFLKDFRAAQDAAQQKYGAFCKPVGDDIAWSAYQNSRNSTLGLMLFGRHLASMQLEVSRRAQEAFNARQKLIQEKDTRLKGKWYVPSAYRTSVVQKATQANYVRLGREKANVPASIDPGEEGPMIKNFGVVNNDKAGSILLMGAKNWNFTINDTWLIGAAHSKLPFYPASTVSRANIFDDKYVLSITGRELFGLAMFGYRQVIPEYEALGSAFQVAHPEKAAAATLLEYQHAMEGLTAEQAAAVFKDAGFRIVEVGI
jgi:hypothetical protein